MFRPPPASLITFTFGTYLTETQQHLQQRDNLREAQPDDIRSPLVQVAYFVYEFSKTPVSSRRKLGNKA